MTMATPDIDALILAARVLGNEYPPEPTFDPDPPGKSYYWDARAEGHDHEAAMQHAAIQMITALRSAAAMGFLRKNSP